MGSSDIQDMTLEALKDGFRADVQHLFKNYIQEVLKATDNERKLQRAKDRFEEGLELSRDAYATVTGVAIKKG